MQMNFEEIIKNQNDEIQSLKAALIISEKRCEQYAQAYDQMHDQLKELIRNRFGKKSERYMDPKHPQLSLFEENDVFAAKDKEGNKIADEEIEVKSHTERETKPVKKMFLSEWKLFLYLKRTRHASAGYAKKSLAMK